MDKELTGKLEAYCETGMEGLAWVFYEDAPGKTGWDATHQLKSGDVLKIFNDASRQTVLWEGVLEMEEGLSRRVLFEIKDAPSLSPRVSGLSWPKNIPLHQWYEWFTQEKLATLAKKAAPPAP